MISERDIAGEWTFNTSMSSRSSSCNFTDVEPPFGFLAFAFLRSICTQGCCLTGARSPEAPKFCIGATKFWTEEPTRAPNQ